LRHALAAGALALLLIGPPAIARADAAPPSNEPTVTTTELAAARAESPDVEAWTSHLVLDQRSASARHGLGRFTGGVLARTTKLARLLTRSALRFLGTPYVFGGTSTAGFDCSGYVQHVFGLVGITVPRTADAQFDAGRPPTGGPRVGDLVFFQTYAPGPSHVGIYLGNGKFVHASSHGVMVSKLAESYWATRYLGAKRLIASR